MSPPADGSTRGRAMPARVPSGTRSPGRPPTGQQWTREAGPSPQLSGAGSGLNREWTPGFGVVSLSLVMNARNFLLTVVVFLAAPGVGGAAEPFTAFGLAHTRLTN